MEVIFRLEVGAELELPLGHVRIRGIVMRPLSAITRRVLCGCLMTALLAVAGCGAPKDKVAPTPVAQERGPALPSERAVVPPPAYTPPPESEMPSDPVHRKLVGTAWRVKDLEARFLNAHQIHARGPQTEPYAPGGITAKYTYDGGKIELNILGKPFSCVWDGTALTINGMPAEALPPPPASTKP